MSPLTPFFVPISFLVGLITLTHRKLEIAVLDALAAMRRSREKLAYVIIIYFL
jgi:hypothetical protein